MRVPREDVLYGLILREAARAGAWRVSRRTAVWSWLIERFSSSSSAPYPFFRVFRLLPPSPTKFSTRNAVRPRRYPEWHSGRTTRTVASREDDAHPLLRRITHETCHMRCNRNAARPSLPVLAYCTVLYAYCTTACHCLLAQEGVMARRCVVSPCYCVILSWKCYSRAMASRKACCRAAPHILIDVIVWVCSRSSRLRSHRLVVGLQAAANAKTRPRPHPLQPQTGGSLRGCVAYLQLSSKLQLVQHVGALCFRT